MAGIPGVGRCFAGSFRKAAINGLSGQRNEMSFWLSWPTMPALKRLYCLQADILGRKAKKQGSA
jgi:hypothetical protein